MLWYMSGYGGQFCAVEPRQEIVLVKLNSWERQPFTTIESFEREIWSIVPDIRKDREASR
ncbi:MAG: hypothetical protein N3A38_09345 [Planctomycetota bacterium]|nr:hypothetical protein [Planctomycetota bacterium]